MDYKQKAEIVLSDVARQVRDKQPQSVSIREIELALLKARRDGLNEAKDLIPNTWLDPLLTGPKAVVGNPPYTCTDIENLLREIRRQAAEKVKL